MTPATATAVPAHVSPQDSPHRLNLSLSLHGSPLEVQQQIGHYRTPAGHDLEDPRSIVYVQTPAGDLNIHGTDDQLRALAGSILAGLAR